MPQNVQSACPARRVSRQLRQQMPEADSGIERLRAECWRCVSHCCTLFPSPSRQEAGVQLLFILVEFQNSPWPLTKWQLVWRQTVGGVCEFASSFIVFAVLPRCKATQVGFMVRWECEWLCVAVSWPQREPTTGFVSLSWNRSTKLAGWRIYWATSRVGEYLPTPTANSLSHPGSTCTCTRHKAHKQ